MWAFVGSARREGGYGKVLVSAKQPATTNTHSLGKSVLAKTPEIRTTFPIQYRVNVYFFSFSLLFSYFLSSPTHSFPYLCHRILPHLLFPSNFYLQYLLFNFCL
uniref:Uncharacterized protein n=1 Tax=Cacopsylla melanoneura TaxID=428564 RepID=A0A8D9FEQ1_9HEMI